MPPSLTAATARVEVRHGPAPIGLAGFGGQQPTAEVIEYPQIRVLLLADTVSGMKVAIISADYCFFDHDFIVGLRRELSQTGTHSIIACTHTHFAPAAFHSLDDNTGVVQDGYLALVRLKILEAVRTAAVDLQPVHSISVGHDALFGNLVMKRTLLAERIVGGVRTSWMHKRPGMDTPMEALRDLDLALACLVVQYGDRQEAILVNLPCHPITLDREDPACGRDFIGPMLNRIEAGRLGHSTALFINGAAGDINPVVWEYGPAVAERFGSLMATEVGFMLKRACDPLMGGLRFTEDTVWIDYHQGVIFPAPISCLWIGDQPFITIPGELYSALGKQIRQRVGPRAIILGYANGTIGYIPEPHILEDPKTYAVDRGVASYYGPAVLFGPHGGNPRGIPHADIGTRMVDGAKRLLTRSG